MKELVSIIVPIYNVEKYLSKCVESILRQTYQNIEIILVDDGSLDNSSKLCDTYAEKEEKITVIHKKNGGLSDARNAGIEAAHGDFLMFIDGDDYINENMVQILHEAIQNDGSDLAICNYKFVDEQGNKVKDESCHQVVNGVWDIEQFWNQYYYENNRTYCVVAWNKLYKKELFENIRYDKGKIHEDEFICHKIVANCKKISCTNDELYYYVQRGGSIMQQKKLSNEMYRIEAFINRGIYLKKNNLSALSEKVLTEVIAWMLGVWSELKGANASTKQRYKMLKKKYNKAYFYFIKRKSSLRFAINNLSFVMGENVYKKTHSIFRKLLGW